MGNQIHPVSHSHLITPPRTPIRTPLVDIKGLRLLDNVKDRICDSPIKQSLKGSIALATKSLQQNITLTNHHLGPTSSVSHEREGLPKIKLASILRTFENDEWSCDLSSSDGSTPSPSWFALTPETLGSIDNGSFQKSIDFSFEVCIRCTVGQRYREACVITEDLLTGITERKWERFWRFNIQHRARTVLYQSLHKSST